MKSPSLTATFPKRPVFVASEDRAFPSPLASLFRVAYAFRVTWSGRSPGIRHRKSLTEKDWKHAVQGQGRPCVRSLNTFTFLLYLKKKPSANPSQLQRILKCLAAAKKPFQLTCRQYITNIWIYCIIVSLFCRFCSELDIFPHLLPLFLKVWNGQIFLETINSWLSTRQLSQRTLLRWLQTSLSENKQTNKQKFKVRFIYRSCYFISRDMKLLWLFVQFVQASPKGITKCFDVEKDGTNVVKSSIQGLLWWY